LSPDNEQDDWITRVGPGLTLAVLLEHTTVRLNYDIRYVYYAKSTADNTISHSISLGGFRDIPIAERMTLDLNLGIRRSGDPFPFEEQITSVRRNRRPYWRYTAGGRVKYHFGEADFIYAGFDYTQLENDDSTVQDSRGYGPRGGFVYWFNIRNGISADVSYRKAELEVSSDYDALRSSGTYTYRFNPRTQANLTYGYDKVDYDEENLEGRVDLEEGTLIFDRDFENHRFSLGLSHQFTPNISGGISAGYSVRKPKTGDSTGEPTASASLGIISERSSFNLKAVTGPGFQSLQAQNLGYNIFTRVSADYTYLLAENLSTSLNAFYSYYDYKDTVSVLEPERRKDHLWSARASLGYLFLEWLSASLNYRYIQRESTIDQNDFVDNRVTLKLTAFHLSEPKPF
jgi:hypothetical protein